MMHWISKDNILIVGLGLMGGSYAKALKKLGYKVEAIDAKQSSIDFAVREGIIDKGYAYPDEIAIRKADVIIFALYPNLFKEWIKEQQHLFKYGLLITDVTGVKSCLVYDIQNTLRGKCRRRDFPGSKLYHSPYREEHRKGIEWCRGLGKILGCRKISILTPEEHDNMIGFVSQLTHVIAVSLMTCNDNTNLVDYTGDSFRDLTRIAGINEKMWSELFLLNKEYLLEHMDAFINEMVGFRNLLAENNRDGLEDKMRLSTQRHAYFIENK